MRKWGGLVFVGLLCLTPCAGADNPTTFYNTTTKTATATSAQSGTVLWTPASGSRIVLQQCVVSADFAAVIRLQSASVDVIPPIYLPSLGSQVLGTGENPLWVGAADATLTYTTTTNNGAHGNVSVLCSGFEDKY